MKPINPIALTMKHLLTGTKVSTNSFFKDTGHWRLPAYIHYLRKAYAWHIKTEMEKEPTTGKRCAHYWLPHAEIERIKNEAADRLAKADKPLTEMEGK